jgi:hypothetical protein
MLAFKDLEFINRGGAMGTQACAYFDNGYGVSVITGSMFYTNPNTPYEVAILKEGVGITYDTHITDDVLGWQTASEVSEIMRQVQELV